MDSLVALVRCEAGRPYASSSSDARRLAVGRLRELELIEKASWSCTKLGREVVGELVGIPVREAVPVRTAPNSIPHGPLRMPRVATPAPGTKFKPKEGLQISKATANRQTICLQCNGTVDFNEECVWVQETGVFHPGCLEMSS